MKKRLGFFLYFTAFVFVFAIQTAGVSADAEFSDVESDHWALESIRFAAEKGIVNGYPNGSFKPEAAVTKEEAAVMLYRAMDAAGALKSGDDFSGNYAELFSENDIAEYARQAIAYCLTYEIINLREISGFTNGPAKGLAAPRVQTAVWAAKASGRNFTAVYYVPYTDKENILDGEMPYVDLLYRQGIMNGSLQTDGSVKFLPRSSVKRCEFAAIANRVYDAFRLEQGAGGSGYYDIEKESVAYKNSLDSVMINPESEYIINGRFAGNASDIAEDELVLISSFALDKGQALQVHIDTDDELKGEGEATEIEALSSDVTKIGIRSAEGEKTAYYLITGDTLLPSGSIAFDFKGERVSFTAEGVVLKEISLKEKETAAGEAEKAANGEEEKSVSGEAEDKANEKAEEE